MHHIHTDGVHYDTYVVCIDVCVHVSAHVLLMQYSVIQLQLHALLWKGFKVALNNFSCDLV